MGYPAKLLAPGEQVVVDVRRHWKYLALPLLLEAFLVAGAIYAIEAKVARWAALTLAGAIGVALLWLLGRYLRWLTTSFEVTSQRLAMRKGVLGRTGREILLDRLSDISYHQSLFDRVLGAGDLMLESAGRQGQEVFQDLPHPVRVQNEISRLLSVQRAAGPAVALAQPGDAGAVPAGAVPAGVGPPGTGPAGSFGRAVPGTDSATSRDLAAGGGAASGADITEQLAQLDQLRRRGVISRREFAAKKAELLSRL